MLWGVILSLVSRPWIGFDTETTGISPKRDRIVTAAVVVSDASGAGGVVTRDWLADPGVKIPAGATNVHGITTEKAQRDGQPIRDVLEEVNAALAEHLAAGAVLVVFNAGFDLPLLEAESERHGVRTAAQRLGSPLQPVADPLVLDRALVKFRRGKRRLSDLATHYSVTIPRGTHAADVDALLTLNLLRAMTKVHPQITQMPASELHEFQRAGHAEWAKDFESYLRSVGRRTRIGRTWF